MPRTALAAALLVSLALSTAAHSQDGEDAVDSAHPPRAVEDAPKVAAFTPSDGRGNLELADDGWLVWSVRDQYGDSGRRVESFRIRFFVQRLADAQARLAYSVGCTHAPRVASVLVDGTLLLHHFTSLTWARPDGSVDQHVPLVIADERFHVLNGYSDGLLVQPYRLNKSAPVHFVPIRDAKLDLVRAQQVTEDDVPVSAWGAEHRFVRGGDVVAWGRHAFDLRTGKRWMFADDDFCVSACDGQTVVTTERPVTNHPRHQRAWPLGENESATRHEMPGSTFGPVSIFAVRNGIGYRLVTEEATAASPSRSVLQAVELTQDRGRSAELLTLPAEPDDGHSHTYDAPRIPHVISSGGLSFWDGKEWRFVAWLKDLPRGS